MGEKILTRERKSGQKERPKKSRQKEKNHCSMTTEKDVDQNNSNPR